MSRWRWWWEEEVGRGASVWGPNAECILEVLDDVGRDGAVGLECKGRGYEVHVPARHGGDGREV